MHAHIVYCHPSENSLTAEIRDAFLRGLEDSEKSYTINAAKADASGVITITAEFAHTNLPVIPVYSLMK